MDNVAWPENYVKGCSMIETETGTTHDYNRCQQIQGKNIVKSTKFVKFSCEVCHNDVIQNKKIHTDNTCIDHREISKSFTLI